MRKYDHLERVGRDEVDGIDIGDCLVFPKLDGTNARVWLGDNGEVCYGSRNRVLTSLQDDNQGFRAWGEQHEPMLASALNAICDGHAIVYGEWLVPHTLRTYRKEVWRRFWVFDVWDMNTERYVHYDDYADVLRSFGMDVVDPIARVRSPTNSQILGLLEGNTYLLQDGAGAGEGVVIKNYSWVNKFGRQTWAKAVRTEFKDNNKRAFGAPVMGEAFQVESAIAEEFVTPTLVAKERAKIEAEIPYGQDARKQLIPRLLATVFHSVVTEEMWPALKKHKFPTVDFKRLRKFVEDRTKQYAPDLFGGCHATVSASEG